MVSSIRYEGVGGIGVGDSAENKYGKIKLGASQMSFGEDILRMAWGCLFQKRGAIKLKPNDVGRIAQNGSVVENV